MRTVEYVYKVGIYWILLVLLCSYFPYCIISRLALRMNPFMGNLSMAETIGSVYGKLPRVITALSSICSCVAGLAIQINVMRLGISMCISFVDPNMVTILATLILIVYSTFGGIRSVTFTDVLQFITFSIIIPFLSWFMFRNIGKPVAEIIDFLSSQEKFRLSTVYHFDNQLLVIISLVASGIICYINPTTIQRVYMSSNSVQAKRVLSYSSFFSFLIMGSIVLISLFVFVKQPDLPIEEVWPYIMAHIPSIFKGFVSISLLAMAMSTADSYLNACAVMVGHDILESVRIGRKFADTISLRIARLTVLILGLFSMILTFHLKNLLDLLKLSFNFSIPVLAAPFILAIFGFRGSSRTALIGMASGVLTILAWNMWVEPSTAIDGSFLAMLANGLAMMAAHYLLKQPKNTGWIKPDKTFRQMQQEYARERTEQKEAIKNSWENKFFTLSKLVPSHTTMVCMGFYFCTTSLLTYFIVRITNNCFWLTLQLLGSACFLGYPFLYDISKKIRAIPRWFVGLGWLMELVIYLPLNVLWNWWHMVEPVFSASLSLTHCAIILWVLPLYIGLGIIAVTLLVAIYPIYIGFSLPLLSSICPLLMVILLLFAMAIFFKVKVDNLTTQNIYLKEQEKIREDQKLKASLYEAALIPSNGATPPKGYGYILNQVVRKVEESISFLDNHTPLFKEDFQSIINKFYDWVAYFNRREQTKDHALVQPTKITLDKLIRKVEVTLFQEMADPPKILVEKVRHPNRELCTDIVCDMNQVVYSLVKAVLRVGKLEGNNSPIVEVQLHPTSLQFRQADSIDNTCPLFMDFQATALVMSQSITPSGTLPKVKECYDEIDVMNPQIEKNTPPSLDLEQDTISSVVRAHYGHLEISTDKKQPTMLLVLPIDVTAVRDKMTAKLPIDSLTIEAPVTPKEQADSMMALMKFHDHVCKSLCQDDPIDIKIISGLLLLLRERFKFKRHESGQLFYVRAVGIAKLVVDWVFHSPKVVYASLLYGLVRRTCLPLSYVKQHYNLGVYAFVSNVVKIDKREALDHPSLLCVQNRLEQAIKEEHIQLSVLFIKLAERLYDLRHAAGYIHLTEVKHMAQETLTIDVQIAHTYLGPAIAQVLEEAAKQAIEVCNSKEKDKNS